MKAKYKKTLRKIFEKPTSSNIEWKDIMVLLKSLGAEISEGRGSRVRILLNHVRAVFHRPHPQKETDKGSVSAMRKFLENAGVSHDEI